MFNPRQHTAVTHQATTLACPAAEGTAEHSRAAQQVPFAEQAGGHLRQPSSGAEALSLEGEQGVIVERVTVNEGGQAIVGNVATRGRSDKVKDAINPVNSTGCCFRMLAGATQPRSPPLIVVGLLRLPASSCVGSMAGGGRAKRQGARGKGKANGRYRTGRHAKRCQHRNSASETWTRVARLLFARIDGNQRSGQDP